MVVLRLDYLVSVLDLVLKRRLNDILHILQLALEPSKFSIAVLYCLLKEKSAVGEAYLVVIVLVDEIVFL